MYSLMFSLRSTLINSLFAQARFPAPEFENYTLPDMSLEKMVGDSTMLRVGFLSFFLIVGVFCFYRWRSRKALIIYNLTGLVVFGYLFTACPCSVGMFQNIVECIVNGRTMSLAYLLLFALPLITALFYGRIFCGGACPLGAIQELLQWKTFHVPTPLDRFLRLIPILIFLISILVVASGTLLPLCHLDPYLPIFLMSFPLPFAIVTFCFLLLGFLISRPFCRYCCPYGVLLRFFSLFSWCKPKITIKNCIACKLCEQGCPNGAIIIPEGESSLRSWNKGFQRLSFVVACIPFVLFLGGLTGFLSAPCLASLHEDVQLLQQIKKGEQTLEVEAFESTGVSLEQQENKVISIENFIRTGMTIIGIFFAACFMAELVNLTRQHSQSHDYSIDASLCLCCGRCYQSCPLETSKCSMKKNMVNIEQCDKVGKNDKIEENDLIGMKDNFVENN